MIGDTTYDMEMARNAGVACVAVSSGVHDRERLLEFDPLALLDSIAELPAWLSNQVRN
jgi:phosphoglycolate phosphatase